MCKCRLSRRLPNITDILANRQRTGYSRSFPRSGQPFPFHLSTPWCPNPTEITPNASQIILIKLLLNLTGGEPHVSPTHRVTNQSPASSSLMAARGWSSDTPAPKITSLFLDPPCRFTESSYSASYLSLPSTLSVPVATAADGATPSPIIPTNDPTTSLSKHVTRHCAVPFICRPAYTLSAYSDVLFLYFRRKSKLEGSDLRRLRHASDHRGEHESLKIMVRE